jgi:hypothetical protein
LGKSGGLPLAGDPDHRLHAAAAAFAALAIWQADKQAKRSAEAIQRERRIDFEVGVPTDLVEYAESMYGTHAQRWPLLASLLPVELIPLTRAALHLETTDQANARVEVRRAEPDGREGNMVDHLKSAIKEEEILAAVSTRLDERSASVGRQVSQSTVTEDHAMSERCSRTGRCEHAVITDRAFRANNRTLGGCVAGQEPVMWCPRGDLNPHPLAGTSTSS